MRSRAAQHGGQALSWEAVRPVRLAPAAAGALLFVSVGVSLGAPLTFDAPFRSYDTGANPLAVTVADFNADSVADLAVANEDSNSVTVWLGNGDGTFRGRRDLATGPATCGVAAADLTGDGFQDLVAASGGNNSVSVWAGRGDGTLTPLTILTAGAFPIAVTLADLNHDALADIVTANFAPGAAGSISVFLGHGTGTFGPRSDFATGPGPTSIALGDLDHDGHLDVVSANLGDVDELNARFGDAEVPALSISVLYGLGDGSFEPKVDYPVATAPVGIALGDLNADGHLDAAVAGLAGAISILMGRADGTFSPARNYYTLEEQWAIALADFDMDGHLDALVGNVDSDGISTYLGRGDGTFRARMDAVTGTQPYGMALGQFDDDERLDVAVANYGCDAVSVHLGNGDGSFGRSVTLVTDRQPRHLAAGDLSGDGRPDLLTANSDGASLSVWIAGGIGSYASRRDFPTGSWASGMLLVDLNRNGQPDIAVSGSPTNTLSVLLGRSNGSFDPPQLSSTGIPVFGLAAADFNNDSALDLAAASYPGTFGPGPIPPMPLEPDSTLVLLFGLGDGTFAPPEQLVADPAPSFVVAADVNEDTFADLLVASNHTGSLSWLAGHGDGTFAPRQLLASMPGVGQFAVQDLDADGHVDVAVITNRGVCVLVGDGAGSFARRSCVDLGRGCASLALGDVDGDGALDLALADPYGTRITILLGAGDATFSEAQHFGTEGGPGSVVIADLDGNGSPDLAAVAPDAGRLSVLHNSRAVPVFVSGFAASVTPNRAVHLVWHLAGPACAGVASVAVQRAVSPAGPYTECPGSPFVPAPAMSFDDSQPDPVDVLWYRLELRWQSGARDVAGPLRVEMLVPKTAGTVLYPPLVPFAGGPVTIRYGLGPGAGRIRLGVYDVRGRLVWDAGACPHEPGDHRLIWDRGDALGRPAARGVYFVRLQAGSVDAVRKLVLSRSTSGDRQ